MSEVVRIRWNSLFSFLSTSIRLLSNVVLFLLIARNFGPEIFGQFTLAHTIATLFIIFADFGIDILLTTEVSRNNNNSSELFQSYYSIKLLFSIIVIISMWLLAIFGNLDYTGRLLLFIFSFYSIFSAFNNYFFAFFKGLEKLKYETKISFIVNGSLLIILILLVVFNFNIITIAVAFVLTRMGGLLISYKILLKLVPNVSLKPLFRNWRKLKKQVVIYGLHILFGNLYFQLDTILLYFLKGDLEVGIYQSVFKLIALPLVIPEIFISSLLPVLSRFFVEKHDDWIKLGKILNKTLLFIVLPISFILYFYANPLIEIIYGSKNYIEAAPILKIFALILAIRFVGETFALLLTTSNRQHVRMIIVISATLLNLVLNLIMIPKLGIIGAAYTSLITNGIVAILYFYATYPFVFKWFTKIDVLTPILFTVLISFAMYFFDPDNSIVFLVVFAPIYLFVVVYFGYSKSEKLLIFNTPIGLSLNFFNKNK